MYDDFDTVNEPTPDDYSDPYVDEPSETFEPDATYEPDAYDECLPFEREPFGDLMEWEREQCFRDEMAERDAADEFGDDMEDRYDANDDHGEWDE